MTDEQWLRRESAALLALLDTCEKPDTWTSIANDCVLEGSAERIYHHHLDPSAHSLEREENDAYAIQGTLLDDPPSNQPPQCSTKSEPNTSPSTASHASSTSDGHAEN